MLEKRSVPPAFVKSARALVLSGGGPFGRYQEGACRHLLSDLNIPYDLVVGNSVGAINGAGICMFDRHDGRKASQFLTTMWRKTSTGWVHKRHWPFGYLQAYGKGALRDTSPLRDKVLKPFMDPKKIRKSNRRFMCVAVNVETQQLEVFDDTSVPLIPVIMGSAAFPGFFPPVKYNGRWLLDGGIRRVTPLSVAIAQGADKIDVVVTGPENPPPIKIEGDKPNLKESLLSSLSAMMDQIMDADLSACRKNNHMVASGVPYKTYHREVEVRVIRPDKPLPDPGFMEFDPMGAGEEHSRIGYHDAVREMAA